MPNDSKGTDSAPSIPPSWRWPSCPGGVQAARDAQAEQMGTEVFIKVGIRIFMRIKFGERKFSFLGLTLFRGSVYPLPSGSSFLSNY